MAPSSRVARRDASAAATEMFHEGLLLPICKLFRQGVDERALEALAVCRIVVDEPRLVERLISMHDQLAFLLQRPFLFQRGHAEIGRAHV